MAVITLATLRDYWKAVYDSIGALTGVAPSKGILVGGKDASGNLQAIKTDTAGVLQTALTGSIPAGSNYIGKVAQIANDGATLLNDYNALSVGDSVGHNFVTRFAASMNNAFNGSTWDRWRNNIQDVAAYSAARTASGATGDFTIFNGARLAVFLDVTAVSGTTPTLDVTVQAKDPVSGKYFAIGAFAQKTAVASEAIFIGGGADVKFPTRVFRIEFTIGGTTPSFTFSIGYAVTVQ